MEGQSLILFIIIGGIAGWLAGLITKGKGFGIFGNILIGIIGAFIGRFLFGLIGLQAMNIVGTLAVAIVGAVVLIIIVKLIKKD